MDHRLYAGWDVFLLIKGVILIVHLLEIHLNILVSFSLIMQLLLLLIGNHFFLKQHLDDIKKM